jgi:hypothetical protein
MCDFAPLSIHNGVVMKCLLLRLDAVCALILRGSELIMSVYYLNYMCKYMTYMNRLDSLYPTLLLAPQSQEMCYVIMVFFGSKFEKFQQFNAIETQEGKNRKKLNTHNSIYLLSSDFKGNTLLTSTHRKFLSISCVGLNLSRKNKKKRFSRGNRD